MKTYPISVSMTPSFYDDEHILLRAQLKCLSVQTNKDFDVWLIDPHYQKRKSVVPELAEKFCLDIKHVPYTPCTRVAKILDCAIFNAAYMYSQAPVNVRYSCYRFVRPNFTEVIANRPEGVNVDFGMLAVGPSLYPDTKHTAHKRVWNFESEDVNWDQIPTKSGYLPDGTESGDRAFELGGWPTFMDDDTGVTDVPLNVYGNIAWHRDQWIDLNGTNEVFTNSSHWEDLDFDCRALVAGQKIFRKSHVMYRLYHLYGTFSQRSNVEVDVPLKKPCKTCYDIAIRNFSVEDYGFRVQMAVSSGHFELFEEIGIWVCKKCLLAGCVYGAGGPNDYLDLVTKRKDKKATILRKYKIGRNLAALSSRMDACKCLQSKVDVFNSSWDDESFYEV